MFNYQSTRVSACGTHHVTSNGQVIYGKTFDTVLPFHPPGLAPVVVNTQAWHINILGEAAYNHRFDKTFGFYCDHAAVVENDQWFHIKADGLPLYTQRYAFAGNFQNDISIVCDTQNRYFHINTSGEILYPEKWLYSGDFREGFAVVQNADGFSSHINQCGELTHNQWFLDLDVYHKGLARALDRNGWHHINKTGQAIYAKRFANIEPFYNGLSRVQTFTGEILVIDELCVTHRVLRKAIY